MSVCLDRNTFLARVADFTPKREYVELNPEFGVYINQVTGSEMIDLFTGNKKKDGTYDPVAWITKCVCAEDGSQIFTEDDVRGLSSKIYNKLGKEVIRVNSLIDSERQEEVEKNSEGAAS